MSSLAAQLAQSSSLNAAQLLERTRRRPAESYLFSGRDAAAHDLEALHGLGASAFAQLTALNPALSAHGDALFSDAARHVDRTLLPGDARAELDARIDAFLPRLGRHLLEVPTGRVLEWLVRRFRIHEFNVPAVLALFLPYHDSPHFVKMASILHLDAHKPWAFLAAHGQAGAPLRRGALVAQMRGGADVARFAAGLLPKALEGAYAHRTLVAFHTGALLEYVEGMKAMDANTSAIVLPPIVDSIKAVGGARDKALDAGLAKDVVLSGYLLLSTFSAKNHLTAEATAALLSSVAYGSARVSASQFINTLLSVLAPQDPLPSLPPAVLKKLLALPDAPALLSETLSYANAEKLLAPLLAKLAAAPADARAQAVLRAVLERPGVPADVVAPVAEALIRQALESGEASDVLRQFQQRYGDELDAAARRLEGQSEEARALLLSLAQSNDAGNLTLASMSSQGTVRAAAVTELHARLDDAAPADLPDLHAALLARLSDPSLEVLQALYAAPAKLAPAVLTDLPAYTSALADLLPSADADVVRLHLTFLLSHLGARVDAEAAQALFVRALFPLLLLSRDRRVAAVAWDAVVTAVDEGKEGGLARHVLLSGCKETLEEAKAPLFAKSKKKKGAADAADASNFAGMGATNIALASRMADNIMLCNDPEPHLSALLGTLPGGSNSSPYARALASLILRAYIGRVPGAGGAQIAIAQRTLDALGPALSLAALDDFTDPNAMLADAGLGELVAAKPKSAGAQAWLGAGLLATCAAVLRPPDAACFITVRDDDADAAPYVRLARGVYARLNAARAPGALSAHVLRALFARLGADALAFLAGVWLGAGRADARRAHTALAHAYAFLVAHAPAPESGAPALDFQAVLPALLAALTHAEKSVRTAAAHCVGALEAVCKGGAASGVYAFDSVYGERSAGLQYLDWADVKRLVAGLSSERALFAADADALKRYVAHVVKQDAKKPTKGKRKLDYGLKVLAVLLSHAAACPAPAAQLALLQLTQSPRDALKARTLRPLLEALADGAGAAEPALAALALEALDSSCVPDLEEEGSELWGVLVKLLAVFVREGAAPEPRSVLLSNLEEMASSLSFERRLELARALLSIGTTDVELAVSRPILEALFTDGKLVIQLLSILQPPAAETVPRAAKKARVDPTAQDAEATIPNINELSAFADVLGVAALPGQPELLTALLEALGRASKANTGSADTSARELVYVQQRLMAALERAAGAVTALVAAHSLRVDVLVDIIRSADAPQTSHQALLLLASLARLAPASVLHNVMPVFTFMGSNVLHRDDSYSFRVIQKTVDSIVPVIVEDLKKKHSDGLELALGAREFVRVFTDAANHIPRHRRSQFFIHLVDALGPDDFLSLVCMLFVSKTGNRIVRQTGDDLHATLALPLALLHHYPSVTQVKVLDDVLQEAHRLVKAAVEPESEHHTVLNTSHDDESSAHSATLLRRRAQALLIFSGAAVERSSTIFADDSTSNDVINKLLLSLLELAQSVGKDDGLKEIRASARTAVGQLLRVVPAAKFVAAVSTILAIPQPRVQLEAVSLLTERIALVSDNVRKAAAGDMGKIVMYLKAMLASEKKSRELAPQALAALRAISASAVAGEEKLLVETVPLVVACITAREHVEDAAAALVPLCVALGPRIIPHFREVVRECLALLKSWQTLPPGVAENTLSALRALFDSIPSFWSNAEFRALFTLYLDAAELDGLRAFVRRVAGKAQAGVVLPALFDVWAQLEGGAPSADEYAAYFELAKRVFRAAPRPAVLEQLRQAFQVLLVGLDLRAKVETDDVDRVEGAVIGAFVELVTKLNETAFRPLFRKLFDWAFSDSGTSDRKIAFLHTFTALLGHFGALMIWYMSIVLQPLLSLLETFVGDGKNKAGDQSLWIAALDVLAKSVTADEGAFWRGDKLAKTLPHLVAQTPAAAELGEEGEAALTAALSALCGALTDDAQVKSLNLTLLMHTRNDDARVRLCALRIATSLWREHGDQLMGFTSETATFISECAEDENDEVVRAARKLKEEAERATGEDMDL